MPTKSSILKHPYFIRACWFFDIGISVSTPIIAFLHYEGGRPNHAIFWMLVAIWSGRGPNMRYLAKLINDQNAEPTTVIVRKPIKE